MLSNHNFPSQTLFEFIFHHENDVKNVSDALISYETNLHCIVAGLLTISHATQTLYFLSRL